MSASTLISFIVRPQSDGRRPLGPLVVGIVAGAVLLGSVASVAARPAGDHTLRYLNHITSVTSTQSDPSGNVFVAGDVVTLGGDVLQLEIPHAKVGTVGVVFTATGAGGSELLGDVAWSLPGGKITAQTLFDVKTEIENPTRKLAITGGTGAYRLAAGEVVITTLSSGDEISEFRFDK